MGETVTKKEPAITPELVASHGLSEEEYGRILKILGRTPTYTELGIFSVMWSEHCSYKSSRRHLKQFPTTGPNVLVGPGTYTLIESGGPGGYIAAIRAASSLINSAIGRSRWEGSEASAAATRLAFRSSAR